jgi:hypothetical protein
MYTPNVRLFIDTVNKRIRIEDTTDFEGLNLSVVLTVGTGTIYRPDGTILASGIAVNRSSGQNNSAWVNLDVDNNGDIVTGSYRLKYDMSFSATNLPVLTIFNEGITTNNAGVNSDLSGVFSYPSSITISGAATAGNNGIKQVSSATFFDGANVINVNSDMTPISDPVSTVFGFAVVVQSFWDTRYNYTGCPFAVPSVAVKYDCDSTRFGSITFSDSTILPSGQTFVSRNLTVSYPSGLTNPTSPAPQTTGEPSITISTLASGSWGYRLTYNVNVVQADGLAYGYTSTSGSQEVAVSCENSLCSVTACLQSIITKHEQSLKQTGVSAFTGLITTLSASYILADTYRRCGELDKMRVVVANMKSLIESSGVDCNCGCGSESGNNWIDNSSFSGQDALDVLQLQIDELNLTVIPLLNQLQDDVDALNDYNAILTKFVTFTANLSTITNQLGAIQAQTIALNPTSASFEADRLALTAQVEQLIEDIVAAGLLGSEIETDLDTFLTDYGDYGGYITLAITTITSLNAQMITLDESAQELLTALEDLTIENFNAEIAGILASINTLNQNLQLLFNAFLTLDTQLNGVAAALATLGEQVQQNTVDIAALQQQTSIGYCKPIKQVFSLAVANQASLDNAGLDSIMIPAEFFTDGAYIKVRMRILADTNFVVTVQTASDVYLGAVLTTDVLGSMTEGEVIIRKTANSSNFAALSTSVVYQGNIPTEVAHQDADIALTAGQLQVNTAQAIKIAVNFPASQVGTISVLEVTGYKSI